MDASNWKRIEDLFHRAAELAPQEQGAFLAAECGADAELRGRVEALLARLTRGRADSAAGGGGAAEAGDAAPAFGIGPAGRGGLEGPGATIGRYKLLQAIGEGGFGVVYMAEQTDPVVRRVALKIIKLGMDTKEVVARFEAERQALALMEHPNIAKVLDGGATETGRPYFVMELVRGVSLTEYCDADHLSMRARIDLFLDVCAAVEHAHQKGIIHRDLKPSNVMVTLHDGKPVPKVIDFGIAKAMHTRLTEKTLFTAYERFIGTPAYMSPEQAEMSGLDVDTRSDVYALGVLLYELLTGSTPFDARALLAGGLEEAKRILREDAPERPSVRISTTGDAALASSRRSNPGELARGVQGDLDWIVMKSLEKERERRYATVGALAADLRRHLADEPVLAGPPSRIYRARKFLVRNRAATASLAVILLLLLSGIVGTSFGMLEASAERNLAIEAQQGAQREAARAEAVTDFLVGLLALSDPELARDPDVPVRSLLDRAARDVEGLFGDQPEAEVKLRSTIGRAYKTLGENVPAEAHLRRADELASALPDFAPDEHYAILWNLTHVLFRLETPDALTVAQRARRVAHAWIGAVHPELGRALDDFIALIDETAFGPGDDVAALQARFERTVEVSDRVLPVGDPLWPVVADTWMAAGFSLWYSPYEAASEPYFEQALAIQMRELAPDHPQIGETVSQLVGVLNRNGRPGEVEVPIREIVERLRAVYAPDNFQLAYCESMLGDNLVRQGRFDEAEPLLLQSHAIIRDTIRDDTKFYVVDSLARVIGLYEARGDEAAAAEHRAALARASARAALFVPYSIARSCFPPEQAALVADLDALEGACGGFRVSATAASVPELDIAPLVERVLAAVERELAPDAELRVLVGRVLLWWAKNIPAGAADAAKERMVRFGADTVGPWRDRIPFEAADAHALLSELALLGGRRAEAVDEARAAWRIVRDSFPEANWVTAHAQVRVARCLMAVGLYVEAEGLLVPSYRTLSEQIGRDNPDVVSVRGWLVELYTALGRTEQADAYR